MTQRLLRASLLAFAFLAACGGSGEIVDPITVPAAVAKVTVPNATVAASATAGLFVVQVSNATGGPVAGATVSFSATGAATVSPASAVTDAVGQAQTTVTAGPSAGPATVVAQVSGTELSVNTALNVLTVSAANCAGLAVPVSLNVGEVATYQSQSAVCVTGAATGSEFVMVAFNSDTALGATTTLVPSGVGTPPSANRIVPTGPLASVGASPLAAPTLRPDLAFHDRLLRSRLGAGRFAGARQWLASRQAERSMLALPGTAAITSVAGTSKLSPSAPAFSALGTNPQVGAILSMNVNGDEECTNPVIHAVRVMAVGTRAVVMADTLNPGGGFTTADYQRFATQFDTLVYPMDTATFGNPTDIDNNGRVGIVFTRAVNELTPANSSFFVGGYFYNRDLFPKAKTATFGDGCEGSNEGELFYMLAPDPNGEVNGNVRTLTLVNDLAIETLAHEFQHLINAARRIYVNQGADDYEITWLNEGLSHVAEELLYYRETGNHPRSNLTDEDVRVQSTAKYALFKRDQVQNFQRFGSYLMAPTSNSPTSPNDLLATRGATWSFLRYSADRLYATDGDVWFRLANSVKRGFATLAPVFGADETGLMRDWATANYLDDLGITSDPRFQHASWNFRDIYTRTFTAGTYPLAVTGLTSGTSVVASLQRTTAGYYRFSVPASGEGLVRLSNTGAPPSASMRFVVVRTR